MKQENGGTSNNGFVLAQWQENGQTFDFAAQIMEDITLNAVWPSSTNVNFGTAKEGYGQPKPQAVTVKGMGDVSANFKFDGNEKTDALRYWCQRQTGMEKGNLQVF